MLDSSSTRYFYARPRHYVVTSSARLIRARLFPFQMIPIPKSTRRGNVFRFFTTFFQRSARFICNGGGRFSRVLCVIRIAADRSVSWLHSVSLFSRMCFGIWFQREVVWPFFLAVPRHHSNSLSGYYAPFGISWMITIWIQLVFACAFYGIASTIDPSAIGSVSNDFTCQNQQKGWSFWLFKTFFERSARALCNCLGRFSRVFCVMSTAAFRSVS